MSTFLRPLVGTYNENYKRSRSRHEREPRAPRKRLNRSRQHGSEEGKARNRRATSLHASQGSKTSVTPAPTHSLFSSFHADHSLSTHSQKFVRGAVQLGSGAAGSAVELRNFVPEQRARSARGSSAAAAANPPGDSRETKHSCSSRSHTTPPWRKSRF